jgi:hypothetical protein
VGVPLITEKSQAMTTAKKIEKMMLNANLRALKGRVTVPD